LPWQAPRKYFDKCGPSSLFHSAFNTRPIDNLAYSDYQFIKGNGCGEVKLYRGAPRKLQPGYAPPDELRLANKAYHATVLYIDAQIGIILDALNASNSRDDTVIIMTGDHGFHLGDKGLYCKHTNFEAATKVPLIIVPARNDPAPYQRGNRSFAPVELLDIMPTLHDIARLKHFVNLEGYRGWHGASLAPILNDIENGFAKQLAASQYPRGKGSARVMGYSVRTTRYRYTKWRRNLEELYDYLLDEWETVSRHKIDRLRSPMLKFAYYDGDSHQGKGKMPWDFEDRTAMSLRPPTVYT
jgi:iduronate 2-sulfatase